MSSIPQNDLWGDESLPTPRKRYRNREKETAQKRRWAAKNPEKCRATAEKYRKNNLDKKAAYSKKWRADNPEKHANYQRKTNYGLTSEQYQAMLEKQSGCCAACHLPPEERNMLVVDHDHETDIVRGLIHVSCNSSIGLVGDDPAKLRMLADYLEKYDG